MNKRILWAGFLLFALLLCLVSACRQGVNKHAVEGLLSHTQAKLAGQLSRGEEVYIRTQAIDSLFSNSTRYLLLLPNGAAGQLLSGRFGGGVTPESAIVVYQQADSTAEALLNTWRMLPNHRTGLDFLRDDEIRIFLLRKSNEGYYIKKGR
jgi:hypothetical protein